MPPVIESTRLMELAYDRAAEEYLRSLPLEHFMESTDQSTQREITLESLALVRAVWPEFQVFSELLIQYPRSGRKGAKPERVVPDNMVVIWPEPLQELKAFHTPLQPVGPTLVMEYVSESNRRKDYEDNLRRYRDDLQVPYYLLFESETRNLVVFHLENGKYEQTEPNASGRLAIPDLDLEVSLVERWVRYWHRGEQLPLPGELLNQLRTKEDQLGAAQERVRDKTAEAARSEQRAQEAEKRAEDIEAENARLREELAKFRG